jgi:Raf kinase inhibitor-like YbhB/YbcL family protein
VFVPFCVPVNVHIIEPTGLPAAMPKDSSLNDGSLQGKNDFGKIGYNGPCPLPGKPHRYFFKVYALDTMLELKNVSHNLSLNRLLKATS